MPTTTLPIWVQYVQAIAVPVIGVIIAVIGAWIALQQMRIARSKLKHDLYDRRYTTFEAARKLLTSVSVQGDASQDAVGEYLLGISNAPFLLDDELTIYLREIGKRASDLHVTKYTLTSTFLEDRTKIELEKQANANLEWLLAQHDIITHKFQPFLMLERHQKSR